MLEIWVLLTGKKLFSPLRPAVGRNMSPLWKEKIFRWLQPWGPSPVSGRTRAWGRWAPSLGPTWPDVREETENQPILSNEVYRELKDGRRLVHLVGYIWLRDWCIWESLFSSFDSLLTPSWSKSCTLRWIGCLQKNRRNKTSSAMSCKSG